MKMPLFRLYLILCIVACTLPYATSFKAKRHEMYVSVKKYFPEIKEKTIEVTWAHAVNSHQLLHQALQDDNIMMLEADILMGFHGEFQDKRPIMAHPPSTTSDLTFNEFLNAVISETKEGKRKGIKLDFKEINAVEPCLKHLKIKLEEESVKFPVFVNADILRGPVNATKEPLDAGQFISLAKKYAPFAVLSVGWTTRFGNDDPLEEIREGKYTRDQMKQMLKVIKVHAGNPPVFSHITFPVRAGLAAHSEEDLLYLTGRMDHVENSLTFWSPTTDPVSRKKLYYLMIQQGRQNTFLDLPFSIEDGHEDENPYLHEASHVPSANPQVEGRGEEDKEAHNGASFSRLHAGNALIVLGAIGLISAFYVMLGK